jgi:deoxycytidine triphosphate deaminase
VYLTDKDYLTEDFYKKIIEIDNNEVPFEAFDTRQIQPASIDLRLSSKVWIQKWKPFGKIKK